MRPSELETLRAQCMRDPEDRQLWMRWLEVSRRRGRTPSKEDLQPHRSRLLDWAQDPKQSGVWLDFLFEPYGLSPVCDGAVLWPEALRARGGGSLALEAETGLPPSLKRREDGGEMVLVPQGGFSFGSPFSVDPTELPGARVYLESFYIDRHPVTVEQYKRVFGTHPRPEEVPLGWEEQLRHPSYPVVGVSFSQAEFFAREVGCRLPSEHEWEKAARGTDGRYLPWGAERASIRHANFGSRWERGRKADASHPLWQLRLAPVESFPLGASPYGVEGAVGNVWEWCEDPARDFDTRGSSSGPSPRALRGGNWRTSISRLSVLLRKAGSIQKRSRDVGFRLVHGLHSEDPLLSSHRGTVLGPWEEQEAFDETFDAPEWARRIFEDWI